jgi:hypothetical protein
MPRIAMLRIALSAANRRDPVRTGQRPARQPAADLSYARGADSGPRGPRARRFASGESDLHVQEGFYPPRHLEGHAVLQHWQ